MSQDIIETIDEIKKSLFRLQEDVEGVLQRSANGGRYEDYVRSATDWVWEADENLIFTHASEAITPVFGVPARLLVGSYIFALNRFRRVGDNLLDLVGLMEERRPFRNVALEVESADGTGRTILLSGVPVFDEETGAFAGYRGTGLDATRGAPDWTARRTAADETAENDVAPVPAESEAEAGDFYHLAVDAARVGVWNWDIPDDRFHMAPGLRALLEIGDDEPIGGIDDWYDRIPPEDRDRVKGEIARHIAGEIPMFDAEHRLTCGDGTVRWFQSRGAAVRDTDGNALRLAGVISESTGRIEAEEALRLARLKAEEESRAKSAFLSHLSHELRTPLNAIIGFSEAIKNNVFGPMTAQKSQEYAADIYEASTLLLGLIDDILDLNRIEAGEMRLEETEVDLKEIVNASLRMVEGRARQRKLSINAAFGAGLPQLRADERAVKQIALNLLTNAVKFTPSGGVISVRTVRRGDGGLRLEISDTGVGIADEDIEKVLKPFGRVSSDLSVAPDGVGLGLPLSKRLIEMHGGSLELHSAKGCGTDVVVDFPASRTLDQAERA